MLPVVQRLGVPVIVLNLQPAAAIDYDYLNGMGDRGRMTGEWLSHCQACSVPEVACVFNRLGLKYDIVTGYLAEESVWEQIGAWIEAAGVAAAMRRNRMGVLGHYYCGMLDVYTDLTRQSAVFGTHVELLEMCELHACAICQYMEYFEVDSFFIIGYFKKQCLLISYIESAARFFVLFFYNRPQITWLKIMPEESFAKHH